MTTCENFGTYSHEQIWHEMKDGAGPSSQAHAVGGWAELAGRLALIRQYVDAAISGVRESQQGVAADAAVGEMIPLGGWMDEAQRLADDTRDRIDYQVTGFTTARDSIPEVPPEPRGWGWKDFPVVDSFTTSDQEADEAFNAEQEQQARAAMMAYQTGTNERVVNVAQFAPPPSSGEPDLSIPTGNRSTIGGLPAGGGGGAAGGAPVPGAATSLAAAGGGQPVDLLSATPPQVNPPSSGSPGPGPEHPGPRPAPPLAPVAQPVGPPGTAPARGPRVPGPGRVGVGRGGPGVPRGGGGFGPTGGRGPGGVGLERGAGGFGPTGSPESAAARGAGAGAGAAGLGRGAGAGPGGGVAPFAGAGAGAGRGGDDHERQRPSYLIEPDPNLLVGDLPPTAPPVIGEDPPDYDEHRRR